MNLLLLADDESCERNLSDDPVDVVIACGDLDDAFITRVAERVGATHVLAVKGNHDSSGSFPNPIIDLHLREFVINGIRFGGFAGAWRYKPRGNYLFDQDEVAQLLADFPPVDVFVAHNSPRRIHDRDDDVHLGFDAFVNYIDRANPMFFIHGHQHVNRETRYRNTTIIGVYGYQRLRLGATAR
jgi:Icc-related predicted phosphoesterase